ncbi:MAG: multidrug transporter [Anaerolineae bacterium]|nr:multidrug transporter [Anaerolineae bacterium]
MAQTGTGTRDELPPVRRVIIEEHRQIEPFNDRARNLSVLNKPLWLFQRESCEGVLGSRLQEGLPAAALDDIQSDGGAPLLVHREDLFFDEPYFRAFWEQAVALGRPCQAAFYATDRAFTAYAVPLTRCFVAERDAAGKPFYRVPLWYFPNGIPHDGADAKPPEPVFIKSNYREVGYYSLPPYMSATQFEDSSRGDLTHLLPARSMLSIESWVHVYYANVLFGVFALGSRFELQADQSWLYRLRILAKAMLEQRQALSCSEVVHLGRNVHIDPSVTIQGPAWIGDNVTIEAGAVITNCIIGPGTSIGNDCQLFLSVVGEACFLPFKASLFMSVMMERSIVAQNTCLQMAVVGRNSFVGAGNTFTDFMMVPKFGGETLMAMGPNGLEPTGQVVLGGCVGHNCRIGSGMVVHPARMIESDVILFSAPGRRVIMRNITFEQSDHHKLPPDRAELHERQYPRTDELEDEIEEW